MKKQTELFNIHPSINFFFICASVLMKAIKKVSGYKLVHSKYLVMHTFAMLNSLDSQLDEMSCYVHRIIS